MAVGIRRADHTTPLYPQRLTLTSPTGGGPSVGVVRSRTKATELVSERYVSVYSRCLEIEFGLVERAYLLHSYVTVSLTR
jgi:hypothetical protein